MLFHKHSIKLFFVGIITIFRLYISNGVFKEGGSEGSTPPPPEIISSHILGELRFLRREVEIFFERVDIF